MASQGDFLAAVAGWRLDRQLTPVPRSVQKAVDPQCLGPDNPAVEEAEGCSANKEHWASSGHASTGAEEQPGNPWLWVHPSTGCSQPALKEWQQREANLMDGVFTERGAPTASQAALLADAASLRLDYAHAAKALGT
ncbi:hypothetical protein H920_10525 [Fukomys damarensis]|uniref:Uncharacterized protein n=1 Tax=Fukomys damarensis TaxID=885580 RepID=A0A091DZB5_FUKDA|nr:hypothetical protein H920_10525 [Fukomys damarensis]